MTCEQLMSIFKNKIENLSYANPNDTKTAYKGWVSNTHIHEINSDTYMKLDLTVESDLFMLFILAIAWSRSGNWENSAFFVAYLNLCRKLDSMRKISNWVNKELKTENYKNLAEKYVNEEKRKLILDSGFTTHNGARKEISLRFDILKSIIVLFKNWDDIKNSLLKSENDNDFKIFIYKMHSICGLGSTSSKNPDGRMSMKILLILRELRIQGVYKNIPGKLCCVPDARVKKASKEITNLNLYSTSSIDSHIKNSEIIYEKFGDWYDIPLFAVEDIR